MARRHAIARTMSQSDTSLERIERALARIEAAAQRRAFAADSIERRHERLRAKVTEAVTALDALIAREAGG